MTIPVDYEYNAASLLLLEQAITVAGGTIPVRDGRRWNDRRTQLLAYLSTLGGLGSLALTTMVDFLSSGVWVDPGGTHLSGTPTFSSGWTVSLLGGAGTSVSDPFDGAHLIGSPITLLADGTSLTTAHTWAMMAHILEQTPPASLSSDINIAIGLCDEAADSASINAIFVGIQYSGASRQLLKGRVQAGVVTVGVGAANASIRAHLTHFFKQGNDSSGNACWSQFLNTRAIDSTGDAIASVGAGSATDHTCSLGSNTSPRPFIAAWRSSTSDGTTRSVGFRGRRAPLTSQPLPTT